ncbi:enoyl-CoA hydratase/isomerase [Phenylobacterium zucineum HLK1]|uniref:Enoyl-CoA hydratase/isomerase n=1 Tax=Phenylobacterium zucineum (strain HLK1) TaxID=450851 RepID=B4RH11_PHEZH|nr:enoyl-CoA hydratase-related protein [Phenylobacterium zucineum]ACG78959.1 enoyl-CoA hydratase/isomerase [Phenylobacterium zucineum HLK1]
MSDTVLVSREEGVAIVTLNRPEHLNAMTSELMDRLPEVVAELARDPQVGCVVLTGAGRGFCAGGDLKSRQAELDAQAGLSDAERAAHNMPVNMESVLKAREEAARLLHDMAKPTIAMVNGPCAGAGFSLAGACDMRLAAETAFFTSAFTRAGLSGDFGGTYFWTKILGTAKARELYFLSERIDAQTALAWGMVNRVYPDAELRERTLEIAKRIAGGPRWAYGNAKRNLNAAEDSSLDRVLLSEAITMGISARTTREMGFLPSTVLAKR